MGDKGSTSTQEVQLSPEAQRLLSQELSTFLSTFLPAQEAAQGDVLRGLGPFFATTRGAEATRAATGMARTATRTAGEQRGMPEGDITQAIQRIEEESPDLLNTLRTLFAQIAMGSGEMVDPRFAQFLRPDVRSQTSPGGGQIAQGAVGLALGGAGLAQAIIA